MVSNEKMNKLYNSVFCLAYPSHYEGFGVAALEPWCANNVIIRSNRGGVSNPIYDDRAYVFYTDKPFDDAIQD